MQSEFEIIDAKREAVPTMTAIAGQPGSGKTLSAILFAAGLAGPGGKVGFVDTEFKRGLMYADHPKVREVLPNSYKYCELKDPFSPERFSACVEAFDGIGCRSVVIDSISEEFEGPGGLEDIAASLKTAWLTAKMRHKRMMYKIRSFPIHTVFCVRSRSKVKKVGTEYVDDGIQPVCEKNFMFDQTVSMTLDPETHEFKLKKCPAHMLYIFAGAKHLNATMGARMKAWSDGGEPETQETPESLFVRGKHYAEQGLTQFKEFWDPLSKEQKKALAPRKDELKRIGDLADASKQPEENQDNDPLTTTGVSA